MTSSQAKRERGKLGTKQIITWLLCTKISRPALMKSAASKHGSNSVKIDLPSVIANLRRSSDGSDKYS